MMTAYLDYAVLAGEYLYPGATVWSNYHDKLITVQSIWKDCNGDVYLGFLGGNANLRSCEWINDEDD